MIYGISCLGISRQRISSNRQTQPWIGQLYRPFVYCHFFGGNHKLKMNDLSFFSNKKKAFSVYRIA